MDTLSAELFAFAADKYPSETYAKLAILKLTNLLLGYHATYHGHISVLARPFQVMLDPANTCQLQCPGCVHSSSVKARNEQKTGAIFDWPDGIMTDNCFDNILTQFAPYALASLFFNYGEPLINRQFPAMVRRAKDFCHLTWVSSNLSLRFDVDAVVSSGLDVLTMSIDGASQETLGKYRRRARWDLCLDNMRKLAEAKRRLNSPVQLCWQFLTFEHNVHEVPTAMQIARDIGIDQLHVLRPFDVSWDDPTIKAATSPLEGQHVVTPPSQREKPPESTPSGLERHADLIDRLFSEGWEARLARLAVNEEPSRAGRPSCEWLYQNITIDAAARIMPCCIAPRVGQRLVYGSIDDQSDPVNTQGARLSRLAFSDRAVYESRPASRKNPPYCAVCKNPPPFGRQTVIGSMLAMDGGVLLNPDAARVLAQWTD